jgi:WD40 repeat protein
MGSGSLTTGGRVAGYETAIVRLRCWAVGRPTAGLGLLVGTGQVVTCAHVVNTALGGRGQREQALPGESDLVQVEFPLLPGAPVRGARVVAWVPPPSSGAGGGDVAGLQLTEQAPASAVPARFAAAAPEPGTWLRVFGYPGSPPRESGVNVDVDLKGEVGGQLLQVESRGGQTVKAQPGFSGSPVWDHATGQAVGLLQSAPFADEPERDAYLLPPLAVAQAWEEPFDYLLVPENPYRGLEPFTVEHAGVFFGRDAEIADLTARVRAQAVVIVVGPSGVGKSSLMRAGLIPALGQDQRWSVAFVQPGEDPWPRLAAGLLHAQRGPDVAVTLEDSQREIDRLKAEGLGPVAEFLRSEDRPLLVLVDQFEELLVAGERPDPGVLDLLLPSADAVEDAARLVVTLRADFLRALQSIPGFHTRLNDRLYLLSSPTTEQMREVVQRPAAARGVAFEPQLADQIVSDAGDALPLLEFTLTRLWETQRHKTLTFAGYHAMGGVRGAMDWFAQDKTEQLGDAAAEVLDRVLLRLVRIPVGGADLATRQRVFQADISAEEWQVLQRLAEARLVVLGTGPADSEPYAELAHETLITAWQRLHKLVAENAGFLNWLAWVQQRAADGDPLPEARIAEARRWLDARPADVPDAVSRFIESSETAAETRLRELRDARDRAEALRLAADAELALRSGRQATVIAVALSVESLLTQPTAHGDIALRRVLRLHPPTLARLDHDNAVAAVAFSPDGTRVATASADGSARVFEAATGAELARLDHGNAVTAVAFSPDGTRVATASDDRSARVFEAATGAELARLDHGNAVAAVAFSPDGTRVATASADLSARVFEAATGAELARLDHDGTVAAVAFSPDGTRVATASADRSARVFQAATGAELARLDHGDWVAAVAFSPDGTRVATASADRSARVFQAATGAELARLDHDGTVAAVAFSPDGTRVATASWDRSARVFEAATGAELARLDHGGKVYGVAFSPDGTRVATASWDRSARVFEAATGAELARLDHGDWVAAVAFSPDGTRVATASADLSARVFEAATGAELARLDHDGRVLAVAFSPDGTRVATASNDRSARVYQAATGAELARLDHDGTVAAVAFSPDGTRVATASDDRSARVFEATPGLLVQRALRVMTRPLSPAELRRYSLPPKSRHIQQWHRRQQQETTGSAG